MRSGGTCFFWPVTMPPMNVNAATTMEERLVRIASAAKNSMGRTGCENYLGGSLVDEAVETPPRRGD